MRAAIYARFSSENQSASSIADQIEVCSRHITKSGWTSVTTYSDAAMSGASRFRPGYQQLLADLDCGLFDVVVVEALDRLGRKLADIADLHDRCTFAGIIIFPRVAAMPGLDEKRLDQDGDQEDRDKDRADFVR